jgi:DNA (cytosine-5)-methyltransferase 1
MYENIRIIKKLRPKYVIWENVKNLLSKKHRHNFDNYLECMESMGYRNYYQVLNAKDYGIPQNRERVFTISIRADIEKEFLFPEKEELKLRLKDMLEEQVDEKYYLADNQIERMKTTSYVSGGFEKRVRQGDGICSTLAARDFKDPKCVQIGILDIKGQDCIKRVYSDNGLSPTLTDMQGGNRQPKIIASTQAHAAVKDDGVVPTLTSAMGIGGGQVPMIEEPKLMIKNNTKQGYDTATDGDSVNLQQPNSETRRGRVGHQVSQTLQTTNTMGVVVKTKNKRILKLAERLPQDKGTYFMDIYNQKILKDESATLKAGMDWQQGNIVSNELRIRKLTPKECFRLMRLQR